MNATADMDARAMAGIATLEVFPLATAPAAELSAAMLRPAAIKRSVRLGPSRRVRIDITEHVRYVLDQPDENHDLAVGSLSGQRLGRFTLKSGVLGQHVTARATVVFQRLGGPAATARQSPRRMKMAGRAMGATWHEAFSPARHRPSTIDFPPKTCRG